MANFRVTDSKIKIFAEDAQIANADENDENLLTIENYDNTKSVVLSDTSYSNRTERQKGFIPTNPASSITMNSAIRQCSVIAKMIADACATPGVLTSSGIDINTMDVDSISNAVNAIATRLSSISKLSNGTARAMLAMYAKYAEGDPNTPISQHITTINNRLDTAENKLNGFMMYVTDQIYTVGELTGKYVTSPRAITSAKDNPTAGDIAKVYSQGNLCYIESCRIWFNNPSTTSDPDSLLYLSDVYVSVVSQKTPVKVARITVAKYRPTTLLETYGIIQPVNDEGTMTDPIPCKIQINDRAGNTGNVWVSDIYTLGQGVPNNLYIRYIEFKNVGYNRNASAIAN